VCGIKLIGEEIMPNVYLKGQHHVAFVHLPKTAGTSIGKWMKDNRGDSEYQEWWDHPTLSMMIGDVEPDFTFATVRNPWDRLVSAYHFAKNIKSPNPNISSEQAQWLMNAVNGYTEWPSFDTWIKNLPNFKLLEGWWWNYMNLQSDWIDPRVDFVIKMEELEKDFFIVQQVFDCFKPLENLLVSDHTNYRDYYTDDTRKLVEKWFGPDIDAWKYSF